VIRVVIEGMAGGWSFGWSPTLDRRFIYPEEPVFVHRRYGRRTPREAARLTEGCSLFAELKRWLDAADARLAHGSQGQPEWRAADKAKMAMEDELREIGRWNYELLETGVSVER
jgi:hypothetical protein